MRAEKKSWKVKSSSYAKNTFNPIRSLIESMVIKPNPQKKMLTLSIGDPTVFGNIQPCEEIIESVVKSVQSMKYNGYAASTGHLEARQAVADYYTNDLAPVEANDVVLCSGCSCALDLCITALGDPGSNILAPCPGFPLYQTLAKGLSIGIKQYNLLPERDWEIDLLHLESQIDENTVAIIVTNPSNPCGSVYSKEHLCEILAVAERHCLPIIADEIYGEFVFPGEEFISMASLTNTVPILSCGGLTKTFIVPGWRMGWIIIYDRNNILFEIRKGLASLSQRIIGSSTLIQGALKDILENTPKSFIAQTTSFVKENADLAFKEISKIPTLKPFLPRGGMYMMIKLNTDCLEGINDDVQFVEELVAEQSVFCLPGKCFDYPNYFRIVLTAPREMLSEACDRIRQFCLVHHRERHIIPHKKEQLLSNTLEHIYKSQRYFRDLVATEIKRELSEELE